MRVLTLLCAIILVGCRPEPVLTPEQYRQKYEAQQAIERYNAQLIVEREETEAVIPQMDDRSEIKLTTVCLAGVKYYYRASGHSVWFAPVVDKTTRLAALCR